jgi:putative spermidine/putrescine transport system permease protein
MRRRSRVDSVLAAYALLAGIFFVLPELIVAWVSFNPTPRMIASTTDFSLRWYRAFLSNKELLDAFVLSFALAVPVTLASLLIGGGAAYAAARWRGRGGWALKSGFVAPLVVPATALGVALFLFLHFLGWTDTLGGVAIGHIVVTLPYTFRTLLAAFEGVDRSLEEAAQSLGASKSVGLWRVTLPLIKPGLVAAALFSFIVSVDEFTITLFVGGRAVKTVPLAIFNATEYGMDPTIAAASTALIVLSGIIIVLLDRAVGLKTAYSIRQ